MFAIARANLLSAGVPGVNWMLSPLVLKDAAACWAVLIAFVFVPQYAASHTRTGRSRHWGRCQRPRRSAPPPASVAGAASWPEGTRAIYRRERPHPGAQLSFSDHDGHRFQVFITNQTGRRIERLEQLHRQRAAIEDSIRCAKDSGLRNLPFHDFEPNAVWLELVLMGQDLTCWTQRLLLAGPTARRWEPKRLRYRLLHVAARLTRHARRTRLHLPAAWPWRHELNTAWQRLGALQPM